MKLQITGASNFVNRMFEACGNYQWAREFLKNSLEAKATQVEFGIEWQAVEKLGVYRRTIIDNGLGMDRDELYRFFSTLGEGGKNIGGIHDNFGVGAKIASLPWNPEGVVVISYKNGQASLIWIVLDEESGDYELVEFEDREGKGCVIDPTRLAEVDEDEIDWASIRPAWLKEHGTIVVLLGSTEHPDTILGNPYAGEKDIKGLSVYLNTRFWDLSGLDVRVVELRSERKAQWPESLTDSDDARRPNNRRAMGARHYITELKSQQGKLLDKGELRLDEGRVKTEWYLWEGERPAIHSYAKKGGFIAVRYKEELFELTAHKVHFRHFGVAESAVQQNLTIILEPQLYQSTSGRWGVHPDQSRNRLIFTGNGEKGVAIPLSDWGLEFTEQLPAPILDAIRAARGSAAGSIEDEDYRKRLQDKFGSRWTMKVLVDARRKVSGAVSATLEDDQIEIFADGEATGSKAKKKKKKRTVKVLQNKAKPDGQTTAVEKDAPVDVPRFRFARKEEFERPWHLALWAPNDPDGPTVLLNSDSSILEEVVKYHQEHYPDVFAEEVAKTVRQVFGEIATCKVAHSQKLARHIPEEELNTDYRSEAALTVSLMGLLAEEAVVAQRLGKLGRKKST